MSCSGQTGGKKKSGWEDDQPEMIIMMCGGWRERWKKWACFGGRLLFVPLIKI